MKTVAGLLCLAAMLTLMSPDLIEERSDDAVEGLVSVIEPGPVCEVQQPVARLDAALVQHRGQLARRATCTNTVSLDNSGYRYRPRTLKPRR